MALNIVLEHDDCGDPIVLAIADPDEALIVYRRRLEEMAFDLCGMSVAAARVAKTEALEQLLGDYRSNSASNMNALFLMEPESPDDEDETWTHVTLEASLDKAFVEVGPLTVHISRTDEGAVADIWGHENDDGPLATTWAMFNDAVAPAAAGD